MTSLAIKCYRLLILGSKYSTRKGCLAMVVSKLLGLPAHFGKAEKLRGELFIRFQQLFAWINHFAADHTHLGGADGSILAVTGGGVELTTKGDIHGYDTIQKRVPIGTNNQVLTVDSSQALGLKWSSAAAGGSVKTVTGPYASDYWEIVEIDG